MPSGGSFEWFASTPVSDPAGHDVVRNPTPDDVAAALDAMGNGWIEFAILDAGDGSFVQAAGSGDGPYQLEHWAGGDRVDSTPAADRAAVEAAFAAYLGGGRPVAAPAAEPPVRESKGLFGRLFGRG